MHVHGRRPIANAIAIGLQSDCLQFAPSVAPRLQVFIKHGGDLMTRGELLTRERQLDPCKARFLQARFLLMPSEIPSGSPPDPLRIPSGSPPDPLRILSGSPQPSCLHRNPSPQATEDFLGVCRVTAAGDGAHHDAHDAQAAARAPIAVAFTTTLARALTHLVMAGCCPNCTHALRFPGDVGAMAGAMG